MRHTEYVDDDKNYRETSNISRTFVGNKIVDNSDVVGASPVGAVPNYIFILNLRIELTYQLSNFSF